MTEENIELILPIPPSVNGLYMNVKWKWRVKTAPYKDFEEHVGILIAWMDKTYKITWNKWLLVEYNYYMPIYYKNWNKKKIDVFNYEKALSDVIEKNIEWFKDQNIKRWIVEKHDSDRNEVEIIIKEI